jgi:uroporphyrinogen III methyltransferase/synthase
MVDRSGKLPLAGISVLVTRAREQSSGLVDDLTSKGAHVNVIPAVSISPLPGPEGFSQAMDRVGLYENIVFTSVNGVAYTLELLSAEGMGPWDLPPALCVGEKTANAWEEAGGEVAAVPEKYTAGDLLNVLGDDLAGRSFLIMRPETVKTELGQEMSRRGAEVNEIVLYKTVSTEEGSDDLGELMAGGGPDVVLFASPSAIEGILSMAAQSPKPKAQRENSSEDKGRSILDIPAICIGPTTAKAAEEAGFTEVYFPDEHTAEGMVEELLVISGKLK